MKKLMFVLATAALLTACGNSSKQQEQLDALEDSLQNIIDQKDQTLNELMGTLNEINEGFAQINEAEGRVNALSQQGGDNSSATASIEENMRYIQETLEQNRQKIAQLEKKVKEGGAATAKLQSMVDQLNEQLTAKTLEIEQLRAMLAEKDIQIQLLDSTVTVLSSENAQLSEESANNAQIARNQDAQLNAAWYVYGTSKELKDKKILVDGEVLQSSDFDKSYFTQIDIRKTTSIALYSKSVKLLTSHPDGSYTLLKDSQGEYTLRITDTYKFWSVSKYLVVRVK